MAGKSLRADVARDVAKDQVSKAAAASPDTEQVTQSQSGDVLEARSTSKRIKTVEDLLKHIEADMSRFEIAASEATKWECGDGDGGSIELHRVFVRLKPKGGPTTREVVQAMIDAARKDIRKPLPKPVKAAKRDAPWQVLVIADPHFGKYAWGKTTGGDDYDLDIAARLVGDTGTQLLATGDAHKPARRTIAFVGDLFHYDRPDGSTTSGTPLERDGRLQKMIQVGCDTLLSLVHQSAETAPTDVVIVNGNHDEVLSWTFQRIMQERFRGSKSVAVKADFTGRQYLTHGRNLLGFAHGHRAKKKLPQIMALEASSQWSECPYREWHTGHFHSQAAEWQRPIETLDGVVVRTAPALCPPDDWHSVNGFIGSRQAMETFLYDPDGGLSSMHIAGVKA
jgi:UDP-2,3-diacylglucosamine pyrophosphatase LpxH